MKENETRKLGLWKKILHAYWRLSNICCDLMCVGLQCYLWIILLVSSLYPNSPHAELIVQMLLGGKLICIVNCSMDQPETC